MLYLILVVVIVLIGILIWVNTQAIRPKSNQTRQERARTQQPAPAAVAADGLQDALTDDVRSVHAGTVNNLQQANPVEVIHPSSGKQKRLFDRPAYPFLLHSAQVPEFEADGWQRCFQQLTDDPRVLGWIAFREETVGASDSDYEPSFLEVLRTYHRTVDRLRREVGMAAVQETSVVGSEGKIWFITAVDDAWLALFLDYQTDAKLLTEGLLTPVLRDGEA